MRCAHFLKEDQMKQVNFSPLKTAAPRTINGAGRRIRPLHYYTPHCFIHRGLLLSGRLFLSNYDHYMYVFIIPNPPLLYYTYYFTMLMQLDLYSYRLLH